MTENNNCPLKRGTLVGNNQWESHIETLGSITKQYDSGGKGVPVEFENLLCYYVMVVVLNPIDPVTSESVIPRTPMMMASEQLFNY